MKLCAVLTYKSVCDKRGKFCSVKYHAANRCNIMATTERRVESISDLTLDNRNIAQPSLLIKNGSTELTSKNDGFETFAAQKPGGGGNGKGSPQVVPNNQKIFVSLISGAVAGAVAKTVIAPLDRTKIYFQTHPDKRYRLKGAWKFIRLTYNNTGILSLWRGNTATMARIMPYASIQFMSHDQYKTLLGISSSSNGSDIASLKPIEGREKHVRHFLAGSLAGVTAGSLTYPLDRARAVMAVTNVGEYKNLLDVFKRTLRNEGYSALYRGFAPTIIGVIPYAGVSFLTYEKLKGMWCNRQSSCVKTESLKTDSNLSPLWRLLFGATAGLLGQTASYPLDIVRRRMQTARQMGVNSGRYSSILGTLIYIYRREGIARGWYKGISMNFIKGPIAVGTSFTVNDYCKMAFGKSFQKNQPPGKD